MFSSLASRGFAVALFAGALGAACSRAQADPGRPRRPSSATGASSTGPSASAAGAPSATVVGSAPSAGSTCDPTCPAIERCEAGNCVPSCPQGEVYIPATGADGFEMGRGPRGAGNQKHVVVLSKPFCMDETEVTVAAYRRCFEAGQCTVPQLHDENSNFRPEFHRDDHPLNMVNFEQSTHYCETRGQALPTEAQWEWAAGHGKYSYPWGDAPEPTCENNLADFTPGGTPHADPAGNYGCRGGNTSPVKSFPAGSAHWPSGELYDLAGNVWEWVSDCYLPYGSEKVTDPNPQVHPNLDGQCYVRSLRGGGWNRSPSALHPYSRAASKKTYRVPGLGFRCVRNPV